MNLLNANQPSPEDSLLAKGWRQGTLFSASSICFTYNKLSNSDTGISVTQEARKTKSKEMFILITQDCDITASEQTEPYVEALLCKQENNRKFLAGVDRNSARWFVVDVNKGLVAEARYRVQLTKQVLGQLTPEAWPSDSKRFERFVRWLARRYDRPALPDRLVEEFQVPIERELTRLNEEQPDIGVAFNKAVHEVRVNLPANEEPPFDLQLLFLVKSTGLSMDEADAIRIVSDVIRASLDPTKILLNPTMPPLTEEDISLATYYATRPLFLEYLTYKGKEIEGAEPYNRA